MIENSHRDVDCTSTSPQTERISSTERREALAAIAKFAKYTGPGIALLLASEQAAASSHSDDSGDCPVCQ